MDIFYSPDGGFETPRVHPYIAIRPSESGFVDFKLEPERISQVLEDFVVHNHEPAIQRFYELIAWLNGPNSLLESCDCALRGPETHDWDFSTHALCVHGRLMLMYRDQVANCDERFDFLYEALGSELNAVDPQFTRSQGAVGLSDSPAIFRDLSLAAPDERGFISVSQNDPGFGYQMLLSFLAFGDDHDEAFRNLERVFKNIKQACQSLSESSKYVGIFPR